METDMHCMNKKFLGGLWEHGLLTEKDSGGKTWVTFVNSKADVGPSPNAQLPLQCLVSIRTFSVRNGTPLLLIAKPPDQTPGTPVRWTVRLVIANGHFYPYQGFLLVWMGSHTHLAKPEGDKTQRLQSKEILLYWTIHLWRLYCSELFM